MFRIHSSFPVIHPTSWESSIRPPLKEQLFELNVHLVAVKYRRTPCTGCHYISCSSGNDHYLWNAVILDARSRLPPSSGVWLPTGACSGRRASLFPCRCRTMMETCSAAVTCEDIFHLNLQAVRFWCNIIKRQHIFGCTFPHAHICICMQVRYHIAHSICPGNKNGVWQTWPQGLSEASYHSCQAVTPEQLPSHSPKSNVVRLVPVQCGCPTCFQLCMWSRLCRALSGPYYTSQIYNLRVSFDGSPGRTEASPSSHDARLVQDSAQLLWDGVACMPGLPKCCGVRSWRPQWFHTDSTFTLTDTTASLRSTRGRLARAHTAACTHTHTHTSDG